jgi:hypothetical protein
MKQKFDKGQIPTHSTESQKDEYISPTCIQN